MLVYGSWQNYYGYANFGPAAALLWSQNWFLLASSLAILVLIALILRLSVAHRSIALYENGISAKFSPFQRRKIYWSEIIGISASRIREKFFGLTLRDRERALLIIEKQRPLVMDQHLKNNSNLIENTKSYLYPFLLPELKEKLHAGQWLSFGKIAISHGEVKIKRKYIPWDQVSRIYLQAGFLVVELQSIKNLRLAVMDIYNLELLLHLIGEHIKP